MAEIPSGYLIDKATKAHLEAELAKKVDQIEAKQAIDGQLFSGALIPEEEGEIAPLEPQSAIEQANAQTDITLTDLEKTLTDRQLKFAWALAKLRATGKGSLTQCAKEAGYSEASASKEGSTLSRNPVICQVALARMPAEARLRLVKEKGQDFAVEGMVLLYQKATQDIPVLDKNGNPTGYYAFDGNLAFRCLEKLGNWMGLDKNKVEIGGDSNGEPVKIETKSVKMDVITIADQLKRLSVKKPKGDAEDA